MAQTTKAALTASGSMGKMGNAQSKIEGVSNAINGVTKGSEELTKKITEVNEKLEATPKYVDVLVDSFLGLSDGAARAEKKMADAAAKAEKVGKAGEAATKKARSGFKGLIGDVERLTHLKEGADKALKVGAGITAIGGSMLAGVGVAGKVAMDDQAAMAQLRRGTMRADGTNRMDDVMPTISQLKGAKSKRDLTEMAAGMFGAGASESDINNGGLASAASLATQGKLDNATAGKLFAGLMKNSKSTDFKAIEDTVSRVADASGMGFDKAMESLGGLASQGENLGISGEGAVNELGKMMVAFSSAGVDNGESVIASMFSRVPRLGENIKHGKSWKMESSDETLKKLGLTERLGNIFDNEGNIRGETGEDKLALLARLVDHIKHKKGADGKDAVNDTEKLNLLTDLFGNEAAASLMKFDLNIMNEANSKMNNQATSQEKLNAVNDVAAAKWQALKNSTVEAISNIGDVVLPTVERIVETVTGVISAISEWSEKHPILTGTIVGVVTVLGGLLVLVGGAVTTFGLLGQAIYWSAFAMPVLETALAVLSGGFVGAIIGAWNFAVSLVGPLLSGLGAAISAVGAFTASLLANPITWIALAIVGAGLLIWKFWEPIKQFFADLWDWFMGAGPVIDVLVGVFMPIIGIPTLVVKHWGAIKTFFANTWDWLVGLWNKVPGWLKWFFPLIKVVELIVQHWEPIKEFFSGLWDGICGIFMAGWEKIKWVWDKVVSIADYLFGSDDKDKTKAEKATEVGKTPEATVSAIKEPTAPTVKKKKPLADMDEVDFNMVDIPAASKGKKGKKTGSGAGDIIINYEPQFEFKGEVKEDDKKWFKKQLDNHKEHLVKLVKQQLEKQGRWVEA
jgi:TP901 family phage tail tape measure protein